MLTELGARIIDADVVAREVVEPGAPALDQIAKEFGDDVFAHDGSLNRAALGEIVFSDDEARRRLNQITHPRIAMRMMKHAEAAGDDGFPWVIYDAALIVENGIHTALSGLIVVTCSQREQLQRLQRRDDLDEEQARQRVDSQLPLAQKVAVADWVIDNDGSLDNTRQQVAELYRTLTDRFGSLASMTDQHD